MRRAAGFIVLAGLIGAAPSFAADFEVSVTETGTRDYYCTTTVEVANNADVRLNEINAKLVLLDGDEPVGETRAGSMLGADPGATASVVLDAPNAPCDAISAYTLVIGICRIDGSFVKAGDCAGRVAVAEPILGVEPN